MGTDEITIGGKKNKLLFDTIKGFKILQLKITKQADGEGLVEVKGVIDENKMALAEKILAE